MNEKQEKALESLKEACDDEDFLEKSISEGDVMIEEDGTVKYSSKFISQNMELRMKNMSANNAYLHIKVDVTNLINFNTDCKVKYDDVVVEKISKYVVENIIRSIKNNRSIEYWEKLNN